MTLGGGPFETFQVPLLTPVVSQQELACDAVYMESARAMSSTLCDRQAQALGAVVDRALFLENVAMSVPVAEYEPRAASDIEREQQEHRECREKRDGERLRRGEGAWAPKGKGKGKGKGKDKDIRRGRFGGC